MLIKSFILTVCLTVQYLMPLAVIAATEEAIQTNSYPYLILDVVGDPKLPKNYRTSRTPYPDNPKATLIPSRLGLETLNASGSAQFTEDNFKTMIETIGIQTGYIIDLRQESHGFLDQTPISWYGINNAENKGKTDKEINSTENTLIQNLKRNHQTTVFTRTKNNHKSSFLPRLFNYQTASLEETYVTHQGFKYLRFYVLDHYPPTDAQIDAFITFIKKLPSHTWLHFHCHAGHGRTTTFMVLYDMIRNAHAVSMEDIIKRQSFIGGEDLMKITNKEAWRIPINAERLHIVEAFYLYAKDPKGYSMTTWSHWKDTKQR